MELSEWKPIHTEQGLGFEYRLSPEDMNSLLQLFESSSWKTYRRVLLSAKDGFQHSMLPEDEPNKLLKTLGVVVGINFAVNQLGILVATFKKQANALSGESKNQGQPKA